MKKLILSIVISLSLLNGCSLFAKKISPVVPPDRVVVLDPKAFELCKPGLTSLLEGASFEQILANKAEDVKIYANCYNKQRGSVELLKKFSNKDSK